MKYLLFVTLLFAAGAFADDRLRDVQAELKNQGFFYGTIDGKEGPETGAAIRRFQIRNGLQVTGALNDETLGALGMGANAPGQPEAEPATPPGTAKPKPSEQLNPPVANDPKAAPPRARDLLREPPLGYEESTEPRPLRPRVMPEDPAVIQPPRSVPSPTLDDWTTFYHGTPFATAPREVQVSTLQKAQALLARRGLYRGVPNGVPGAATSDALFAYQDQRHLHRTGRLDLQTLSELNLLPGRGPDAPPLKPFYNPNRRRDPSVDERGLIR
jgi:peptidoglycan hydrolase-like protein with peptidoglycan-binding domain